MSAFRLPDFTLDAICDSGARAVFSRGNLGVVDCTTAAVRGGARIPLYLIFNGLIRRINVNHMILKQKYVFITKNCFHVHVLLKCAYFLQDRKQFRNSRLPLHFAGSWQQLSKRKQSECCLLVCGISNEFMHFRCHLYVLLRRQGS